MLELLRAAADHLAARAYETPRLDAELLLARALQSDRLRLYVEHDMPVADEVRATYRELIKRRASGEPVAYILGEREFYGLVYHVDARCLVPRPETEHLVDEALAHLVGCEAPRVVDVGTGSGCIAISIAHRRPDALVVATDRSSEALEVARGNAGRLVPAGDVAFFEGDLLAPVADLAPFDLVASNPPYITRDEMTQLPLDVRAHEPPLALDSGDDAVAFHKRILEMSEPMLAPAGAVVMELGDGGAAALAPWLDARRKIWCCRTVQDLAGVARVLVCTRTK